ncbi:MAG: hypothetical protein J5I93_02190 [Pirellulaceae bacterium]|nr:hypothetical protein [Pirellulaceae bacterium]
MRGRGPINGSMRNERANAFYFAFVAGVSGIVGTLVGRRLRLRGARLSLRHVIQAFLVPVCLTLAIAVVRIVDASAIPGSEYHFAMVACALISTMVIAFPYLAGIDMVSRQRIRLKIGIGVMLAAMTVICLALAAVIQLGWRTTGLYLVIAMVWFNWTIVAALLLGSIDGRGPTRAACLGALVPTAAFGFTTLFKELLTSGY